MPDNTTQTAHIAPAGGSYNPYNGFEALKIIMGRIYEELKNHQDFGSHLAYTRFSYKFNLEFIADKEGVTKGSGSGHVDKRFEVNSTGPAAPDDGRREAGLVVPQPTLTTAGLVDIPLQKQ